MPVSAGHNVERLVQRWGLSDVTVLEPHVNPVNPHVPQLFASAATSMHVPPIHPIPLLGVGELI